jgi:hypothetical protein
VLEIGFDKVQHLAAGYTIYHSMLSAGLDATQSFLITFSAAAGKELIWDKALNKGTCDLFDFIFTVVGIYMNRIVFKF